MARASTCWAASSSAIGGKIPQASRGRIYDRLTRRLDPKSVFLDVDNIQPGLDFFDVLSEKLGVCDALIAVIGKNWNSSADKDNRRRLDDLDDFVRIEIEAALQRGIRVIPVLVDGATMPRREDLPDSLQKLRRRQAIEISHNRFDSDVERLTQALALIEEELRLRDAAEAERAAREERERQAAEAARAEEARRLAGVEAAWRAEEERRARKVAEAERAAREKREQHEAAEAARRAEERRAREVAEVERAAREERERQEAADAAAKVAEARRPGEAEAARQPKDANDGSRLFSGTGAIEALSAPRSPPVRAYSPIIAATIAIGIAAALAILVATFGSPAWKFSAPAGDKVAEHAASDKAAADKAAADKAAADRATAEKVAAEQAASDKAAADKAAADRATAEKAAAEQAASDKAAADKAAADKAAADKAAAEKSTISVSSLTAAQELALKPGDSFKECSVCPEMIVLPAGRFTMGSPDQGDAIEQPQHEVIITKPFAAARFALTFDEWDACAAPGDCASNVGDNGWGRGRRPGSM